MEITKDIIENKTIWNLDVVVHSVSTVGVMPIMGVNVWHHEASVDDVEEPGHLPGGQCVSPAGGKASQI